MHTHCEEVAKGSNDSCSEAEEEGQSEEPSTADSSRFSAYEEHSFNRYIAIGS